MKRIHLSSDRDSPAYCGVKNPSVLLSVVPEMDWLFAIRYGHRPLAACKRCWTAERRKLQREDA